MEKNYWENFYKTGAAPSKPSLFAEFMLGHYLKPNDRVIEFGCGNGRDSIFLAQNGIHILAIDQCEEEISVLKKHTAFPNLEFRHGDFTKLGDIGMFDHIYSRFTLHTVSEKEENDVIKWAHDHLLPGGKIAIEARGKKNELYMRGIPVPGENDAYVYENHYRRFIDIDALQQKFASMGFNIEIAQEESGFAPFQDTDYTFIRLVASKK